MPNNTYQEVANVILNAKSFIVVSHSGPDPDAYASSLGLAEGLRLLGKKVSCHNESGVLSGLSFLPFIDNISKDLPSEKVDFVLTTDVGTLPRVGNSIYQDKIKKLAPIINIDHHYMSNDLFGAYNLVEKDVSSASEMVYKLLKTLNVKIDSKLANLLMIGIYSDTVSLQKGVITEDTYRTVAELKSYGADVSNFSDLMFWNESFELAKLKGYLLSNLEPKFNKKYAEFLLTPEIEKKYNVNIDDTYSLKNLGLLIDSILVTSFIRNENGVWKVSLRSKGPIDVNSIASNLGGGGHICAAATKWKGDIQELIRLLNIEIENQLKSKHEL